MDSVSSLGCSTSMASGRGKYSIYFNRDCHSEFRIKFLHVARAALLTKHLELLMFCPQIASR